MMRRASTETEISPKTEEKKTAPTDLQSMHGRKGDEFDKKKNIKVKPIHKHFIHAQAYIAWHVASDICFHIRNWNAE